MKKELNPYDYYYDTNTQPAMMVANGHQAMAAIHHPFSMQDSFLQILGKHHIILFNDKKPYFFTLKSRNKCSKPAASCYFYGRFLFIFDVKINTNFPSSYFDRND